MPRRRQATPATGCGLPGLADAADGGQVRDGQVRDNAKEQLLLPARPRTDPRPAWPERARPRNPHGAHPPGRARSILPRSHAGLVDPGHHPVPAVAIPVRRSSPIKLPAAVRDTIVPAYSLQVTGSTAGPNRPE